MDMHEFNPSEVVVRLQYERGDIVIISRDSQYIMFYQIDNPGGMVWVRAECGPWNYLTEAMQDLATIITENIHTNFYDEEGK